MRLLRPCRKRPLRMNQATAPRGWVSRRPASGRAMPPTTLPHSQVASRRQAGRRVLAFGRRRRRRHRRPSLWPPPTTPSQHQSPPEPPRQRPCQHRTWPRRRFLSAPPRSMSSALGPTETTTTWTRLSRPLWTPSRTRTKRQWIDAIPRHPDRQATATMNWHHFLHPRWRGRELSSLYSQRKKNGHTHDMGTQAHAQRDQALSSSSASASPPTSSAGATNKGAGSSP